MTRNFSEFQELAAEFFRLKHFQLARLFARSHIFLRLSFSVILDYSSTFGLSLTSYGATMRAYSFVFAILFTLFSFISTPGMTEEPIGFVEEFALSNDREETLKQLIPGTEDYFYYHSLHFQHTQKYDEVEKLLKPWIEKFGYTERVQIIRNRQALLTYPDNHKKSLEHIRQQTGTNFNHQRVILGQKPALPTSLDQKLISRDTLTKRALKNFSNTDGFEDRALTWVPTEQLKVDQRRHLLARLTNPDHPGLVDLIVKELNSKGAKPFGSYTIHKHLLPSQLDVLLEKKPDLLHQQAFIDVRLRQLIPGPDIDWQNDPVAHRNYLESQWAFVKQLGPAQNSLKANVLYHILLLDMKQAKYDRALFIEYIQLPRHVHYINPRYMELAEHQRYPVNLASDYNATCKHPPIRNDEALVRAYLLHFYESENDFKAFAEYIHDDYLKRVFAEAKIVNELGDPKRWANLLTPEEYRQLKERVDLDFVATNRETFSVNDPVAIEVFVKNVPTLIVKVFEINAENFYRQKLQPLDTDINLDGLVPNGETVHTFDEPSVRRIKRRFEFPEMKEAGVYVVDFIGNGKSSRALIRKGRLQYLVNTVADGQQLTILDEEDQVVRDAKVWLTGREFSADKDGHISGSVFD